MDKLNRKDFIEAIKKMTLSEINELVNGLQEEFGIDLSSLSSVQSNSKQAEANDEQETKTFKVIVTKFDDSKKINVIKAVMQITGLQVMQANKLISDKEQNNNRVIKEGISRKEAEDIQKKLVEAGAEVKLE
ncbi:50S ribosomal protein L7/L12 [Candidatus Phytoplasma melaleucae]|uniref:Large ribosomal subunit protein bL12 n=1 Tax=Candidatus Phytoplasma melaleucae TaxID=2982630 RepID=A0ABT9DDT3_9MOLU|nr:50S ribosomal protein L7/L12 ['Melaleuca sp.' phytoplasma]MDO8168180.1 50S ribosomal protein L7/L12 ['Melaleuca sp.' phytoplasma]MDV3205426.1 50S ribosomal protein L7/L12 [Weeping tea tree witches'-broom phytoplasma]